MATSSGWYAVMLDGRLACLVAGFKDARIERRRLVAQHPGARVTVEAAS